MGLGIVGGLGVLHRKSHPLTPVHRLSEFQQQEPESPAAYLPRPDPPAVTVGPISTGSVAPECSQTGAPRGGGDRLGAPSLTTGIPGPHGR